MLSKNLEIYLSVACIPFVLVACAPVLQHRGYLYTSVLDEPDARVCEIDSDGKERCKTYCETRSKKRDVIAKKQCSAVERYNGNDGNYVLGFIEFDDQGILVKRRQMEYVLRKIKKLTQKKDALIIVYMHGWKHNAALTDRDVALFRNELVKLSQTVGFTDRRESPLQVVGIYLAWPGAILQTPVLKEMTFWDRKTTAHTVGHVGTTEVLSRLELIRNRKNEEAKKTCETLKNEECAENPSKLIVIGHSFGGAAIYAALSQILENRFVRTVNGPEKLAEGFGDLVVLINPAFEALLYSPMSDMSITHEKYVPDQLPVLAVLTSEGDWATGTLFPFGRFFSTLFETEREGKNGPCRYNPALKRRECINEETANRTAVGHFDPYVTHCLRIARNATRESAANVAIERGDILRSGVKWREDEPGSTISFSATELVHLKNSGGRNPYLMVQVDDEVIDNDGPNDDHPDDDHHNDMWDGHLTSFIRDVILIATQTPEQAAVIELRANGTSSTQLDSRELSCDKILEIPR
jgi:hypothetical protein